MSQEVGLRRIIKFISSKFFQTRYNPFVFLRVLGVVQFFPILSNGYGVYRTWEQESYLIFNCPIDQFLGQQFLSSSASTPLALERSVKFNPPLRRDAVILWEELSEDKGPEESANRVRYDPIMDFWTLKGKVAPNLNLVALKPTGSPMILLLNLWISSPQSKA